MSAPMAAPRATTAPSTVPTTTVTSTSSPPPAVPSRRSIRANSMQPTSERAPLAGFAGSSSILGRGASSSTASALLLFGTERNSEESHAEALAAAQAEHERVRQAAIQAFEMHEMRLEAERLVEEQQKQQERIAAEERLAQEAERLRALEATKVQRPPPAAAAAAATAPPVVTPAKDRVAGGPLAQASPASTTPRTAPPASMTQAPAPAQQQSRVSPLSGLMNPESAPSITPQKPAPSPLGAQPPQQAQQQQQQSQQTAAPATTAATQAQPSTTSALGVAASTAALVDRYSRIHRDLKTLRAQLSKAAQTPGTPLNQQFGEMRRVVRRSVGQLTTEKAANTQTTNRILEILRASINGTVPSPPVSVAPYLLEDRPPLTTEAAAAAPKTINDSEVPSLFLYLVNIFSKSIIRQFIDECGANPAAADPIGVATASVFSQPDFQWRGGSLIDILMAKFRVVCPVVFGLRGKDTTEQGRVRVGWRREGGAWIPEQMHNDRMTGLGAGFAAVSLRKFGRVARANPYPPRHFWRAMAAILNTPEPDISVTQMIVLKAMIQNNEDRILEFFGTAGLAVLKVALVDFPRRAPPKAQQQAMTLAVLGDVLRRDKGLVLPV